VLFVFLKLNEIYCFSGLISCTGWWRATRLQVSVTPSAAEARKIRKVQDMNKRFLRDENKEQCSEKSGLGLLGLALALFAAP
jgi:hypothetical protein